MLVQCVFLLSGRDGEEWHRVRHAVAPKMMRPKIVEENINNFNAIAKVAVDRLVKLKETCGPEGEIPDLEGELKRWSTESEHFHNYLPLV